MGHVQDLQRLVEDRLRELGDARGPLSARRAAARSGGKVSYETLNKITRGEHSGNISQRIAEGIALALDVPASRVYDAAGQRRPLGRFELPRRADRLTEKERSTVLSVVDAILEASAQDRVEQEGPGLRAVARRRGQTGGAGQQ